MMVCVWVDELNDVLGTDADLSCCLGGKLMDTMLFMSEIQHRE